jgi:hypothetical protein
VTMYRQTGQEANEEGRNIRPSAIYLGEGDLSATSRLKEPDVVFLYHSASEETVTL